MHVNATHLAQLFHVVLMYLSRLTDPSAEVLTWDALSPDAQERAVHRVRCFLDPHGVGDGGLDADAPHDDLLLGLAQWAKHQAAQGVLMSRHNPGGWKLEELIPQLRHEYDQKTANLAHDERQHARVIASNNRRIQDHLSTILALHLSSMHCAAQLGPDQGPTGTPRVGVGSEAAALAATAAHPDNRITVNAAAFDALTAQIEAPVEDNSALRELMARPSRFAAVAEDAEPRTFVEGVSAAPMSEEDIFNAQQLRALRQEDVLRILNVAAVRFGEEPDSNMAMEVDPGELVRHMPVAVSPEKRSQIADIIANAGSFGAGTPSVGHPGRSVEEAYEVSRDAAERLGRPVVARTEINPAIAPPQLGVAELRPACPHHAHDPSHECTIGVSINETPQAWRCDDCGIHVPIRDASAEARLSYTELRPGDFLQVVGADAEKWAEAFQETFPDSPVPRDVLAGWFANAIGAGMNPTPGTERPRRPVWPAPTPEQLASPAFQVLWEVMKSWDIGVPYVYTGYTGTEGNHIAAILNGLAANNLTVVDTAVLGFLKTLTNNLVAHGFREIDEPIDGGLLLPTMACRFSDLMAITGGEMPDGVLCGKRPDQEELRIKTLTELRAAAV